MPDEEFRNRTVLVTGGSRGIGRAICVRLAATGARIAINYASSEKGARQTLAKVTDDGSVFTECVENEQGAESFFNDTTIGPEARDVQ